jgi:Transposase
MGVFIGLDVSLSKTAVCVVDRDGAVLWQGKVPSEPGPLITRLAEWSGVIDLARIEACPLSEWLHRGLREAGIPMMCIEVRHAQRFLSSRPVKTDRNDVRGMAEMMRLGHYRPVHVQVAGGSVDAHDPGRLSVAKRRGMKRATAAVARKRGSGSPAANSSLAVRPPRPTRRKVGRAQTRQRLRKTEPDAGNGQVRDDPRGTGR